MHQLKVFLILLCLVPSLFSSHCWAADFAIELQEPKFVLPRFTGPYQEREASITPDEYEMADTLSSLLDTGNTNEVVTKLNSFYDIELSPAMLLLKAQVYLAIEQYDDAERTFKSVLRRMPQLIRAHADLGQMYLVLERYNEARVHFSKAVALGSNEAMIHGQLAYLNLQNYGAYSAINSYQTALTLEPDNTVWQQGLLSALTQAKMYEAAKALVYELIEKNPNQSYLWLNLAVLSLEEDNAYDALKAVEMAMLLGDTSETNLKTAVQLHLQMSSYDRATTLIEQHLNQYQLNMQTLNLYIGWLSQNQQWEKVNQVIDSQNERFDQLSSSEQSQIWLHKANVAAALNHSTANESYKKALMLAPDNGNALIDYGRYATTQKQYDLADTLYIRAEALEPHRKAALLGRAQVMFEQKLYLAAHQFLSKALAQYPELNYLEQQIAVLKSLSQTELVTSS